MAVNIKRDFNFYPKGFVRFWNNRQFFSDFHSSFGHFTRNHRCMACEAHEVHSCLVVTSESSFIHVWQFNRIFPRRGVSDTRNALDRCFFIRQPAWLKKSRFLCNLYTIFYPFSVTINRLIFYRNRPCCAVSPILNEPSAQPP